MFKIITNLYTFTYTSHMHSSRLYISISVWNPIKKWYYYSFWSQTCIIYFIIIRTYLNLWLIVCRNNNPKKFMPKPSWSFSDLLVLIKAKEKQAKALDSAKLKTNHTERHESTRLSYFRAQLFHRYCPLVVPSWAYKVNIINK